MNDQPETTAVAAPDHLSLLRLAVEKGAGADELEKLAALAERLEANRAKAAFSAAMNECQKEMPVIVRDAKNTQKNSTYVKLETVQAAIRPIYTKHGFAISWGQGDAPREGYTRVLAKLYHIGGHAEQYQGDYPLDGKGAKGGDVMNALQGTVSSHTYAQRDMLRLMFQLTIADYDLDGERTPAPSEGILADQVTELKALARDSVPTGKVLDTGKFFKWLSLASKREVATFEELNQDQYLLAKTDLLARIREKEGSVYK